MTTYEWGFYTVIVRKNGRIVKKIEYENMSGTAMMDEVKWLKSRKYPPSDGYEIEW